MYNKVISGYNYGIKPFSVKQYCNIVHNKEILCTIKIYSWYKDLSS